MEKITIMQEQYPQDLKQIENPPEQLYLLGNQALLRKKKIAIVGSRCCTEYGRKMAYQFAKQLSEQGICVVSGLAKGIDTAAHLGAMEGRGGTIAILGSGLNKIYPPENTALLENLIQNKGLAISEYNPDKEAASSLFPERNRIVSGIGLGTLVIEAAYRSGTSITVALTKKQGKPVFCIPNSLESSNGVGTNRFLKQGAILVTSVEDILKVIGQKETCQKQKDKKEIKIRLEYRELYEMIKNETITMDILHKKMPNQIGKVEYLITMMEIEGLIRKQAGGVYRIEQ